MAQPVRRRHRSRRHIRLPGHLRHHHLLPGRLRHPPHLRRHRRHRRTGCQNHRFLHLALALPQ